MDPATSSNTPAPQSPREAAMAALEMTPDAPAEQATPEATAPAAEPTAATPAEPPKPAETKPAPLSPQLAQLAKRDKELRAREEQLKAREAKALEIEAIRKEAALNPLKALETFGLTFEQLQDFVINGKQPTAEQKVSAETQSLRSEIDALKKAREEESKRQQDAALAQAKSQWMTKAAEAAKASADYEFVAAVGQPALDMAHDVLQAHFAETGEPLPLDVVLKHVEEYFEQQSERLLTTKKVKAKMAPVVTQPAAAASSETGPSRVPRSLPTASAPLAAPPSDRPMTRAERRAAAMAALEREESGA